MIAGPVWDAGEAMARNPRWTVAQIAWVFVARDQDWTEAPYFDTLEATAVANRKSQMQNHRRAGRRRCKPFH